MSFRSASASKGLSGVVGVVCWSGVGMWMGRGEVEGGTYGKGDALG